MPPKSPKVGKFIELAKELADALKAFSDAQGTTFTYEVEDAIRRHLAYPPDRRPEPLPDAPKPRKPGTKRRA